MPPRAVSVLFGGRQSVIFVRTARRAALISIFKTPVRRDTMNLYDRFSGVVTRGGKGALPPTDIQKKNYHVSNDTY